MSDVLAAACTPDVLRLPCFPTCSTKDLGVADRARRERCNLDGCADAEQRRQVS